VRSCPPAHRRLTGVLAVRRADTALYEAKSSGRDRVVEAGAALEDREGRWPRLVRSERRTASEDGGNPRSTASRS